MKHDLEVETKPLFGPGERLRVAREAQDIAIEDIAKELRLNVKVIEALEENNHEQLPARAFVTGYLKGYARILNIDAEPLIADYHCSDAPLPVINWVKKDVTESTPLVFRKGVKFSLWKAWLALLVAAGIYFLLSDSPSFLMNLSDQSDDASIAPLVLVDQSDASSVLTDASGQGVDAVEKSTDAPLIVSSKVTLLLSARGESWVDVRDVNGDRLIFSLLREGDRREVEGEPPLQVLLGDSSVIDIVYNNQPFDQSSYNDGKIARFTLNAAQQHARF